VENKKVLIRVRNVSKHFPIKKRSLFQREQLYLKANNDITLDIYEGETFGLVGESGCGKTTLGRVILQLYPQTSGDTLYYGRTLEEFKPKYVKRTIDNLPTVVIKYRELQQSLSKNYQGESAPLLSRHARKITKDYLDTARIAGGLVVADNLNEVSRVLLDEYESSGHHFTLAQKMADLILKRDTLEETGAKTPSDEESINNYNHWIMELTPKLEHAKADLEKKREGVQKLRAKYMDKAGFAEADKHQDPGIDLARLTAEEQRVLRRDLQIIFQDPYSSLNPRLTVGQLISEALIAHNMFRGGSELMEQYVLELMGKCGLQPYMLHRYPHQFSGGQRQRIGIARALSVQPKFVVCDEAVSALDVSIQSQIINLLVDLKEQNKLTYLFISHDLSVVKFISDRIGVMYLGNLVELASSDKIFREPLHPYTEALLEAIPTTEDESGKELAIIKGDIPSPIRPPSGCKFHTRCKYADENCKIVVPEWRELRPGHFVACHCPLGGGAQGV